MVVTPPFGQVHPGVSLHRKHYTVIMFLHLVWASFLRARKIFSVFSQNRFWQKMEGIGPRRITTDWFKLLIENNTFWGGGGQINKVCQPYKMKPGNLHLQASSLFQQLFRMLLPIRKWANNFLQRAIQHIKK